MIMSKSKILVFTFFLLFCTLMPLANAAPNQSMFFVKVYAAPENFRGKVEFNENLFILDGTQWGFVTDEFGDQYGNHRIGRVDLTIMLVARLGPNGLYDAQGTSIVQFVITFDNGRIVEGVAKARIVHPTIDGNQIVEGQFVGHGDMHVVGVLQNIEVGSGFALNGYSW